MKPIEFTAHDGMKLYGYLTTPAGVEAKDLPMVEFVHGGPWSRDEWGFNRYAQWLSNRGYAVLQINFRGSTGYGKQYVNAGDRQWAGTMHTDLLDGKDWAVKQGVADPAKVCIMGGSYGGYATLAGVAFSPEAFACGVDIVGPSNLNTLLKTIPPYWSTILATFRKRMGDSEEVLEQQSPLFKADQIKAPLLIGQGANDPRVNKAESDQIVAAMRKNNKPVQYYVFPDEGHGFARPANNMAFNAVTEEFLAKYLGGRFEPATPDESKLLTSIKQ
jgi:dipeptidyl aminopeptidase/acylaminoacyl peptidase